MLRLYILDGHKTVEAEDMSEFLQWFATHDRTVAKATINGVLISTIFIGVEASDRVFETMIFGGKHDQYQDRYYTWDEAEAGHKRAVHLVTESQR